MSIKSHTLVEPYEYVSVHDAAVDSDAPDFEERWRLYLDGAGEPPLKPGAEPVRYQLRHVTNTERGYLMKLGRDADGSAPLAAAAIALVGMSGAKDGEGKPLGVEFDFTQYGLFRIKHASQATLDRLGGLEVLYDIGGAVFHRMSLRPS